MSRGVVALLICLVVAGNTITIALLLSTRPTHLGGDEASVDADDALGAMVEAIDALRAEVDRLSRSTLPRDAASSEATAAGVAGGPSAERALAERMDGVIERLESLEKTLATMRDTEEALAAEKIREEWQARFRADDGFTFADELLAQKKYAVGANGILSFLDAHPEHPDARDLMKKAVGAFHKAGYGEKALWLQRKMMEEYPDPTGQDLYSLSMLENQLTKYDDALRHIEESVELAPSNQRRLNRLFYRAFLIHQRDGDPAGLEAYREVERLAKEAGGGYPAEVAKSRADEIEGRLAAR